MRTRCWLACAAYCVWPVCACVDHQSRTTRALRLVVHPANAMPVMLPRKTSPHDEAGVRFPRRTTVGSGGASRSNPRPIRLRMLGDRRRVAQRPSVN